MKNLFILIMKDFIISDPGDEVTSITSTNK
jgi:hypothetical protein